MENFIGPVSASYSEDNEKNKNFDDIFQKAIQDSRNNGSTEGDKLETRKIELTREEHFFEHAGLHVLQSFSRGKESFILKMLQAIIDTIPPTINDLNNAIQNKDWISVNKFSHKLIPNMNMSGNSFLENEMIWIESHCNLEESQLKIVEKWPTIKLEVEKTMTVLKKAKSYYKRKTFGEKNA